MVRVLCVCECVSERERESVCLGGVQSLATVCLFAMNKKEPRRVEKKRAPSLPVCGQVRASFSLSGCISSTLDLCET